MLTVTFPLPRNNASVPTKKVHKNIKLQSEKGGVVRINEIKQIET
jgi:hypothetical protein